MDYGQRRVYSRAACPQHPEGLGHKLLLWRGAQHGPVPGQPLTLQPCPEVSPMHVHTRGWQGQAHWSCYCF